MQHLPLLPPQAAHGLALLPASERRVGDALPPERQRALPRVEDLPRRDDALVGLDARERQAELVEVVRHEGELASQLGHALRHGLLCSFLARLWLGRDVERGEDPLDARHVALHELEDALGPPAEPPRRRRVVLGLGPVRDVGDQGRGDDVRLGWRRGGGRQVRAVPRDERDRVWDRARPGGGGRGAAGRGHVGLGGGRFDGSGRCRLARGSSIEGEGAAAASTASMEDEASAGEALVLGATSAKRPGRSQ